MSNEFYVPPLALPRPPIIDGPQPICKCCFQSGHLYRDCNHPSLGQLHDLLVRVFVGAHTNPRRNSNRSDSCEVTAFQKRLISRIPTFTMRALLFKSKHSSLLLTQHLPDGQPAFPSIRSWRQRVENLPNVVAISPERARNFLPNRIGVYSAAARYDLEEMIWINYNRYAEECIMDPQNIHLAQLRVSILNAQAISLNLNRFRRALGNSSSDHAFTPHGLAVYTDNMIQYLTTMRDRQIMMMAPGVNVRNDEETDGLFAQYDDPNPNPISQVQYQRFAHLNRSQMRNNIQQPYAEVASQRSQWVSSSYLHPHFPNSAPMEQRTPEYQDTNITSALDPLNNYRIEGNVTGLLHNLLPEPPIIPEGIDITQINEPPALASSVQRRTPTFNICIEPDDSAKFPELLHNSCAICWDELTPETCCATNCKHTYCFGCMTGALKRERRKTAANHYRHVRYMSLKCAMCRQEIQDLRTYSTSEETEAAVITLRNELYTPLVRN